MLQAKIIKMTPKKCVINSKKHLSLAEIQNYIDVPGTDSDDIQISVLGLNKVAATWRRFVVTFLCCCDNITVYV